MQNNNIAIETEIKAQELVDTITCPADAKASEALFTLLSIISSEEGSKTLHRILPYAHERAFTYTAEFREALEQASKQSVLGDEVEDKSDSSVS
jgi:hypothetical protein